MLGAPGVRAVRGVSDFGYSFVYVIFEDGTDLYWARSRTLEYLSPVIPSLPEGVKTSSVPTRWALGGSTSTRWSTRRGSRARAAEESPGLVPAVSPQGRAGVAEVAASRLPEAVPGQRRSARLRAYGIPIQRVVDAVRGGTPKRARASSSSRHRVHGARPATRARSRTSRRSWSRRDDGIANPHPRHRQVTTGPDLRRGVAELDGRGEVVSGIVVMRQGQNALDVIDRVKRKLAEVGPACPRRADRHRLRPLRPDSPRDRHAHHGDRRGDRHISLIILLFLWHLPSALIPVITIRSPCSSPSCRSAAWGSRPTS